MVEPVKFGSQKYWDEFFKRLLVSVGISVLLICACPCRLLEDAVIANKKFPNPGCIP